MRKRLGPLTKLECSRIVEALHCARTEPERMRPMLNEAEAAALDMFRRLRAAQFDTAPSVSRLADYLGWTRPATVERLEGLRRKGFIKRASDCSTYLETVEAVGFRCIVPLVAMCLDLARIDPRNEPQWRRTASIHHANALDIAKRIAQLVPDGIFRPNTNLRRMYRK